MKTSSNIPDSPEGIPQPMTGQDLTDNNDAKKASRYFLKEKNDSPIPSNQSLNVKGGLMLLVTLFIALAAFLMTACDDEPEFCTNCPFTDTTLTKQIEIHSIRPLAGARGSIVTIILENFNNRSTDQYVTFGTSRAEIVYARSGMLRVRVPMDLKNGDYPVRVRLNQHVATAPQEFKVTDGTK